MSFLHGKEAAEGARRASEALFGGEVTSLDLPLLLQVLSEAPSSTLPRGDLDGDGLDLVEAVARAGLWPSKSAARNGIAQGAVYVNEVRRQGGSISRADLVHDRYIVLRKGRRDYHLLCLD